LRQKGKGGEPQTVIVPGDEGLSPVRLREEKESLVVLYAPEVKKKKLNCRGGGEKKCNTRSGANSQTMEGRLGWARNNRSWSFLEGVETCHLEADGHLPAVQEKKAWLAARGARAKVL